MASLFCLRVYTYEGDIDMDLEDNRVYYAHDSNCSEKNFSEVDEITGLKQCLDCSSIFDADGKGVAVTSTKFDEWRQ